MTNLLYKVNTKQLQVTPGCQLFLTYNASHGEFGCAKLFRKFSKKYPKRPRASQSIIICKLAVRNAGWQP